SGLRLIPGVAQSMEASADGLEYTIALRPDAVWEDGQPVSSRDAVFTIQKVADPKVPAPVFKPLFEELVLVEVIDGKRFRVRFSRPYAFRPMAFVLPVLPAHRFEKQNFLKA